MSSKSAHKPEGWLLVTLVFVGLLLFLAGGGVHINSFIHLRIYGLLYGASVVGFFYRKTAKGRQLTLLDFFLFGSGLFFGFGTALTPTDNLMVSDSPEPDA